MLKIIIGLIRLIISTVIHSRKDLFIYIAIVMNESLNIQRNTLLLKNIYT